MIAKMEKKVCLLVVLGFVSKIWALELEHALVAPYADMLQDAISNTQLQQQINSSVATILQNMAGYDAFMANMTSQILAEHHSIIEQKADQFKYSLSRTQRQRRSVNDPVVKCLVEEGSFDILANEINEQIKKCATVAMVEMVNVISNSLNEAQTFMSIPQVIGRDIQRCGLSNACRWDIVGDAISEALQVHGNVPACNYQEDNGGLLAAKSALADLEKIVNAVVEIAVEAINGLENSLKLIQKYTMNVAKDLIYQLGEDIFEKLDDLKEDAYTIGVDIIDCIDGREEDLKELPMVFLNKTTKCAVDRINEVLDSFSDVAVDVGGANEELKNLTDQLDQCGNDIKCIEKMMEEIAEAASKIPDMVKADIKKSQEKIDDLVDYLFECEHDNYNQMQITSQEIFNGLVECIENKLVNRTTPATLSL